MFIFGAAEVNTSKTDTQENDKLLELREVESEVLWQFYGPSWISFFNKIMTLMNLVMLLKEKENRSEFGFLPEALSWMGCAVVWVTGNHLWYCREDEGFWPPLLWCWNILWSSLCSFLLPFGVWCDLLVSADEYVLLPQWNPAVSHSLVPARSVLGHGWQRVAVTSPPHLRSLQPSYPVKTLFLE